MEAKVIMSLDEVQAFNAARSSGERAKIARRLAATSEAQVQQQIREDDQEAAMELVPISRDVLDAYRATGEGWQARMHDALRMALSLISARS